MENDNLVPREFLKEFLTFKVYPLRSYIKKIASIFISIFFPWLKIWRLQSHLQAIKTYNYLLMPHEYKGDIAFNEVSGLLNWPELLDHSKNNSFIELVHLINLYFSYEDKIIYSHCWILLAIKNFNQLIECGYNNFKRTIANNYFNFLVQEGDPQIKSAEALFSSAILDACKKAALNQPIDVAFQNVIKKPFFYYYFVFLLWEYVKKLDKYNYLSKLEEPKEGNPVLIYADNKAISQDLANSLIEYYSISEKVNFKKINTVLEIGGGYGRNIFVILTLNPTIKTILIDIMPALYIAQKYLSSVFRNKKIFYARNFANYQEVKEEMESASIIFLLPTQLSLLPDKKIDLSFNISSFGEMTKEQITWYIKQIDRVTSKYFYTKQWNVSKNPFDNLIIEKDDYSYPPTWEELYSRNCIIQSNFFESLYKVNSL